MNIPPRESVDDLPILAELGALLERRFGEEEERPSRTRQARSAWPSRVRRAVELGATLASMCLVAVVVVFVLGAHHRSVPTNVPGNKTDGLGAALSRPATAKDRLPRRLLPYLSRQRGLQPDRARLLISTAAVKVWVVPEAFDRVCLVIRGGYDGPRERGGTHIGCGPIAVAEREGSIGIAGDNVVGVLPGRITALQVTGRDGSPLLNPRLTNGAFAFRYHRSQLPLTITYRTTLGRQVVHVTAKTYFPLLPRPGRTT